jgi:hypothetical protein
MPVEEIIFNNENDKNKVPPLSEHEDTITILHDDHEHSRTNVNKQRSDSTLGNEEDFALSFKEVLQTNLSEGPLRFAPKQEEPSMHVQINSLSKSNRKCIETIKQKWERRNPDCPFTYDMYLRFGRATITNEKNPKYNEKLAWKLLEQYDHHYLSLTAEVLEPQLLTKVRDMHCRVRSCVL